MGPVRPTPANAVAIFSALFMVLYRSGDETPADNSPNTLLDQFFLHRLPELSWYLRETRTPWASALWRRSSAP